MLEKRQAIRYRLGEGTDIVIFRDGGNLVAPLLDLSQNGLMTSISDSEAREFIPGQEIRGQLRRRDSVIPWRGSVVHCSPARRGRGVGIAFIDKHEGDLFSTIKDIVQQPDAGGLHLKRAGQGLILEVHGRLSFLTSRDALAYIRRGDIRYIDLSHCTTLDSAGLGMLCLAKERRVAIAGAHGSIARLLAIARITESGTVDGTPEVGSRHRLH